MSQTITMDVPDEILDRASDTARSEGIRVEDALIESLHVFWMPGVPFRAPRSGDATTGATPTHSADVMQGPLEAVEVDIVLPTPPVRRHSTLLKIGTRARAVPRIVEPENTDEERLPVV